MRLEETRTLLLNSWGMPHDVLCWEDAITQVYSKTAIVLAEYDLTVSSPTVTMRVPAVLQLQNVVPMVRHKAKCSPDNVFARDEYRCQYCGHVFKRKELSRDHVYPKRLGGQMTWNNVASACRKCNGRKGGRTPEQAGMRLLRRPTRPGFLPLRTTVIDPRHVPPAWEPYVAHLRAQLQVSA